MCHLKLKLLSFNRNDNQGAKLRKRFFFIQYLLKEICFLTLFLEKAIVMIFRLSE